MKRETILSNDRLYRYTLWRDWDSLFNHSYCVFIGLNPSTADETQDDPTIRRCIDFAKRWDYGALCMLNLFAYRSTDPAGLSNTSDPIGPLNNYWLNQVSNEAGIVIAAWGVHGAFIGRDCEVSKMIIPKTVYCLGLTKDGFPRHPLYVRSDTKPTPFTPPSAACTR